MSVHKAQCSLESVLLKLYPRQAAEQAWLGEAAVEKGQSHLELNASGANEQAISSA